MKKFFLVIIFIWLVTKMVSAQISLEAQVAGANFLGATINARYNISMTEKTNDNLTASLGLGILAPWFEPSILIVNAGFGYKGKAFGFGVETAVFPSGPFVPRGHERNLIDMIVYPNLNYTITFSPRVYLRLSGGLYLPFVNEADLLQNSPRLIYQGDVIPGAGIGIGYLLK